MRLTQTTMPVMYQHVAPQSPCSVVVHTTSAVCDIGQDDCSTLQESKVSMKTREKGSKMDKEGE